MKKLLLLGAALVAMQAQALDMYVIGGNVNGKQWSLAEADALMTETAPGVYEWDGTTLGSGFKFNDGTWNNETYGDLVLNIGSNGDELVLGEDYYFANGGSTGDIATEGAKTVNKPHVVLNLNDGVLVVTGEEEEFKAVWHIAGNMNDWTLTEMTEGADGIWTLDVDFPEVEAPAEGEEAPVLGLKVASQGWTIGYGYGENTTVEQLNADNLSAVLTKGGENMPYSLVGTYTCAWNPATETLVLTAGSGVAELEAEAGEAVYYNLQGVKVNAPVKGGVYVKVLGGKSVKVLGNK